MNIHKNFAGGNIFIKERRGNTYYLENEQRDTTENWFYWAFCVEGAENETVTFQFEPIRLGYWGPAVSYDLVHWRWLNQVEDNSFTYHFAENEKKVYFAHHMLYHPDRFLGFCKEHQIGVQELCKSRAGESVPCIQFGNGNRHIILTSRHHCCESTGSYVLEGVLEELLKNPIPDTTVFCVPFVDYDGVVQGDQGKFRAPHDHELDYIPEEPIYPECRAVKEYICENGCNYGFDFHSPWHCGGQDDKVFIVQNSWAKKEKLDRFGELLEQALTPQALGYRHADDFPPDKEWNTEYDRYSNFMTERRENDIAFAFETAYFGTQENKVEAEKMTELGHCFVNALKAYMEI